MLSAFAFAALLALASAQASNDLITNLPGIKPPKFKQYAGYITVDAAHNRRLFYWFVESQESPKNDPVVLWLNGGPGCSSLGGFLEENGPFRPKSDGSLESDIYSWNNVANVVYLESPAGVGFSFSDDPSDYTTGDVRTANDTYTFLQTFFSADYFGKYVQNDFWITGESYGGHYVPEAAARILQGNAENNAININLAGFMAGNPWTDAPVDNAGAAFYWWSHALISDATYAGITQNCNFSDIGPLALNSKFAKRFETNPDLCNQFLNTSTTEMGNINIYDIYVKVCTKSSNALIEQLANAGSQIHKHVFDAGVGIFPNYKPCEDTFTYNYLNRKDVQQAIHANLSLGYPWVDCSPRLHYSYSDLLTPVTDLYQNFRSSQNLRILVYSGDVDAIVPYTGTRQWIANLGWEIVDAWRPWTIGEQVGGYVQVFDGLTFATVRDAGHMVPETQPERAFHMFSHFLANKPL